MMPTAESAYTLALWFVFCFAAVTFPVLLFVPAPYGRHARPGWGPTIPTRLAWLVMEAPPPIVFLLVFVDSPHATHAVPVFLCGLWLTHYVYRSFIFPFRLRIGGKRKPWLTVALAFVFNSLNAFANAYAIGTVATHLNRDWLSDPRFLAGAALFFFGYGVNHQADAILRRLRRPGESGYRIPYGGLFRWVSSPNYLGELIEWLGFALAAWTLPAGLFFLFTAANLIPRSLTHHHWYREHFNDYPRNRKAILPYAL